MRLHDLVELSHEEALEQLLTEQETRRFESLKAEAKRLHDDILTRLETEETGVNQ